MADAITGIVRIIHIVTSVFWVGGAALWSMVIAPRVLARGPPQIRGPFAEAAVPAVVNFLRVTAVTALLSGLVLVGMIWGWDNYGDAFQLPTGGYGLALGIGAVAGIGMAIVGLGMAAPTAMKSLAIVRSLKGPPTAEQQAELGALGKKVAMYGMVAMTLGTIAMIGMAWAVNVFR